ncbi:MAG: TIGR02996 domain-containing protein [Pyrinomonadaceae bacterium]
MTEEEILLLQAVLNNPDEDPPRLDYANWCREQIDESTRARADFIRTQIMLVRQFNNLTYEDWFDAVHLEKRLRQTYSAGWAGTIATLVEDFTFNRGFIEMVTVSARRFLENAEQLLALAPIRHLKLTEVRSAASELFVSPYLGDIISMEIERCGLNDEYLKMLAESPVLKHLKWLSVAENDIGLDGADALAGSDLSKQLVYVNFYGNPVDPGGQYSRDNELIIDSWLPETGQQLEAKHGYLGWLHRNADTVYEAVPDRFRLT